MFSILLNGQNTVILMDINRSVNWLDQSFNAFSIDKHFCFLFFGIFHEITINTWYTLHFSFESFS